MHARLEQIMEDADRAFWQAVKEAFPEVVTDELPIAAEAAFRGASFAVISKWLDSNLAEPIRDEQQGGDDGG